MKRQLLSIMYILLACMLLSTQLWAEQWKINFNGYPGTMELNSSGTSYSGRFNLHGNWEEMLDLQVYRNSIFFRRSSADQKYLGVIEDGRMQGVFTQHGSGRYPWTAERSPLTEPFDGPPQTGTAVTTNLALKKTARQSSTSYGGTPDRAVDGNHDGNHYSGSVSHSGGTTPNDWWEVDLGNQNQINNIKIWNRTDCCGERLSNFYVMVSPVPFTGNSLQTSLADQSNWRYHVAGTAGRETTIPVNVAGRYVRIQLAGQNWLSLAEVEVFGTDNGASPITRTAGGTPVTIYWHMADDADVYLNGKPLRNYSPSFKTRPDEAPRPAFSARATLKNGDIFTVGGRRGGSYGLMLIAVDDSGKIIFKTDHNSWAVYEPGERSDWFEPSVAHAASKRPVTVQPNPWYPQKELNSRYQNSALSIWSEPDKRYAYLFGVVKTDSQTADLFNPSGTWRHHPGATWVITQKSDGSYYAQEHGLGNASGPAYFTQSGNFRIDYITRDGAVKGFYEVTFALDGRTAVGRVQELTGPRRSGTTNWTRE